MAVKKTHARQPSSGYSISIGFLYIYIRGCLHVLEKSYTCQLKTCYSTFKGLYITLGAASMAEK